MMIPTTFVLVALLVGFTNATNNWKKKRGCPRGLMGAWMGTAQLLPEGRIAIGACTQKGGADSAFTDMDGNPCTQTVCNNANIVIGSSGRFCTLNVFGSECPGGEDRDLLYKCQRNKNEHGAKSYTCRFIKTIFNDGSGQVARPTTPVTVSALVRNGGKSLQWTPMDQRGNTLGTIVGNTRRQHH